MENALACDLMLKIIDMKVLSNDTRWQNFLYSAS
jgi:hypothetical protein